MQAPVFPPLLPYLPRPPSGDSGYIHRVHRLATVATFSASTVWRQWLRRMRPSFGDRGYIECICPFSRDNSCITYDTIDLSSQLGETP